MTIQDQQLSSIHQLNQSIQELSERRGEERGKRAAESRKKAGQQAGRDRQLKQAVAGSWFWQPSPAHSRALSPSLVSFRSNRRSGTVADSVAHDLLLILRPASETDLVSLILVSTWFG